MYGPAAAVVAMTYVFGPLSELHVNPAVTPAFAGRRVLEVAWVVPYLVVQMAGATLAALFLPHVRPRCLGWQLPDRQARWRLAIVGDGDRPGSRASRQGGARSGRRRRAATGTVVGKRCLWCRDELVA